MQEVCKLEAPIEENIKSLVAFTTKIESFECAVRSLKHKSSVYRLNRRSI